MKRKLLSLLLSLSMLASLLVVPAMAAEPTFSDLGDHWAKATIEKWAGRGIVKGDENGKFRPDDNISRAEIATVMDNLMGYQTQAENTFKDLAADAWYASAILSANAAGIIKGAGDAVRPTDMITRQEVAVMMTRVLDISGGMIPVDTYSDVADIAPWALDAMNAMVAKGYVKGNAGKLLPTANITRAEVITIMDNVFAGYYAKAETVTGDVVGSAVVNVPGVTLKNMKISGDLIIAEGVGTGDFTLNNVTVAGKVIVRGCGVESFHIVGNSKVANLHLAKGDGAVRVVTEGNAEVTVTYIDDGKDDVIIEGTFGTVSVDTDAPVTFKNAKVDTVTATANGVDLTVDKNSKITTVATKGENTQLTVAGTVANVAATKEATGLSLNVAKGGTAANVTTAAAGSTVTNEGKVGALSLAKGADTTYVAGEGTKLPKLTAEDKTNLTATTVAAEAAKAAADKAAADLAAAEALAAAATTDSEKALAAEAKAAAEKASAEAAKAQDAAKKQDEKIQNDANKSVVEKPVTPPTISDGGGVTVPDAKPLPPSGGDSWTPPDPTPTPTPTPPPVDVPVEGIIPVNSFDQNTGNTPLDVKTSVVASKEVATGLITINLSTDKPLRIHKNSEDTMGTWVGFAIKAPKGITNQATYTFGTTESDTASTSAGTLLTGDPNVGGGVVGDYYFDAYVNATALTPKTHLTIDWDGAGTEYAPQKYVITLFTVKTEVQTVPSGTYSTIISEAAQTAGLPADGSVTVVSGGQGELTQAAVNTMGQGGQYVVYYTIPKTLNVAFDNLYYSVNGGSEANWAIGNGGSEEGWFYTADAADYFKIGGTYANKSATGIYTMKGNGKFVHTMRFVKDGNITAELRFEIDFSKYTIAQDTVAPTVTVAEAGSIATLTFSEPLYTKEGDVLTLIDGSATAQGTPVTNEALTAEGYTIVGTTEITNLYVQNDGASNAWAFTFNSAAQGDGMSYNKLLCDASGNEAGYLAARRTTTWDGAAAHGAWLVTFEKTATPDVTAPTLENATLTGSGAKLTLTVDANDVGELVSVEVDHSLQGKFPEFTLDAKDWSFTDEGSGLGVDVVYATTEQKWTATFNEVASAKIRKEATSGDMTFYFSIKDKAGNQFGSMYAVTADMTKVLAVPAWAPTAVAMPVWSNTATPNAAQVNEMMTALWATDPSTVQGIPVTNVFSYANSTLTINKANVTDGIKQWITAQWGGTSVPVALTLDNTTGVTGDANWSGASLAWIDLATVTGTTATATLSNGAVVTFTIAVAPAD